MVTASLCTPIVSWKLGLTASRSRPLSSLQVGYRMWKHGEDATGMSTWINHTSDAFRAKTITNATLKMQRWKMCATVNVCFGNYASETMFRQLCFGNYASETMLRQLYASETMLRKPCFGNQKGLLRKLCFGNYGGNYTNKRQVETINLVHSTHATRQRVPKAAQQRFSSDQRFMCTHSWWRWRVSSLEEMEMNWKGGGF